MGDRDKLIELCEKAHSIGINIYVDVIVTHFGNAGGGDKSFTPHETVAKEFVNNKFIWREKKGIDYNSRYSITHHCNGLAAVRLDNHDYQNSVISFFNELIDCGVDGLRLDSAKMIATPEENFGENKNEFFTRVIGGLKKSIEIFGEVLFESKENIDRYEKYINILTEFGNESYNINKEKTILFIESHDTFNDIQIGYTSAWSDETIVNNYAFLVKDFGRTLFYARPYNNTWKSDRIREINLKNK